ncbi:molybdopterin molybdotransferase MoeA [Ostreibacterium oceani]|uniref:Molybdopterin molybdenumtransferase n=1 Tax=Ostreibacterium oceani TaxID=2654998 RepID=A0A6N7F087_9GAMM|nr:gephyrin-like molybdotransferase Glp [Ostreibacterium oceani]MPV85256.1 molybdopterin molybdenumtransferase MoeA [Ostreibacterium oceani]
MSQNNASQNKAPPIHCDFDPAAITIAQAKAVIKEKVSPLTDSQWVALRQATGRVLAKDIAAPADHPPTDNSAMDGYAVIAADVNSAEGSAGAMLTVVGDAFAGSPFTGTLQRGQAVRIMTGGVIPKGADAVVMQEETEMATEMATEETVEINAAVKIGQNIRLQGENLRRGEVLLTAGTQLCPASIGLLATMGIAEVPVVRKIRVAIISTGDELQPIGSDLAHGNIYDSNRYMLIALLTDPRFEVIEKGTLADQQALIEKTLVEASQQADVIITTGGVSVGEADWIKDCVTRAGELIFWKAAIKPGRPITFGRLGQAWFFGLPGNPVSVMITFQQFVLLALEQLMGQQSVPSLTIKAKTTTPLKKRPGRTEFQRGWFFYDENGQACVESTGDQGSGILSSVQRANCMIVLATDQGSVGVGEWVSIQPNR